MVFRLDDVFGAEANELRTSDVRRRPRSGLGGDDKIELAVSDVGLDGRFSEVNQNMYINPGLSESEMGFANSAKSKDATWGLADDGMRDRNSPVREDGSRSKFGR